MRWKIAFLISVAVHCAAIPIAFHYSVDAPPAQGRGEVELSLNLSEELIEKPVEPAVVRTSQPEVLRDIKPAIVEPQPEMSNVQEKVMPLKVAIAVVVPTITVPTKPSAVPSLRSDVETFQKISPPVLPPAPVVVNAAPRYRENHQPFYPSQARRKKQEGIVTLIITVNTNGTPMKVEIKQGTGFPSLDEAAVEAVSNWQFEPAKIDNRPIISSVEIPISFKLSK